MVSFDEMLMPIEPLHDFDAVLFIPPESITKNIDRILRSNFLIPVVNHDFFHYSGIRKWAAVEMKHILMIEVKI